MQWPLRSRVTAWPPGASSFKLNRTMSNNPYFTPGSGQSGSQFGAPGPSYQHHHNPTGFHPMAPSPATRGQHPAGRSRRAQTRLGFTYAIGYVAVIWVVHLVNVFVFGGGLTHFGIYPLDPSALPHIFTSPILHVNFEHLISNTVPGAIFAFLIGFSGHRVFWEVTAFVVLIGGIGVWFLGGVGTNHVGASMLVYGWLGYLLVRGFFNRDAGQIGIAVMLGLTYSGFIWGVLPTQAGVSWQAHLFGGLGGVAAGMLITSDDPPTLQAKRQASKAQKQARRDARKQSRSQF